ncbi:hypothetical protein HHO41_15880 [Bacillus sp. DNRA2]|uniref:hypothetical protein n=1 Tax=Bacillus sp. DNRA2 TaxID=2723053 RepID=UPI00145E5CE0|nr:hypothetical protein [Bacillus sp. DNRA2]NMD71778.1 hypothetical protein [Bacillus sp. DNRA2]
MNVSGWKRSYVSRFYSTDDFLIRVASDIEQQLQEWDENYQVYILKLKNYKLNVKNGERYYHMQLDEEEVDSLQRKSPFSLDVKIWKELEKEGLIILKGYGDYLDSIL